MPVTERVARLREQSLQTLVTLSTERADLLTEFYRQDLGPVSAPVRRARAFRYLMAHQTIYIGDGELIVGEEGPFPKAAPLPRTLRPLSGGPGYSQFAGKILYAVSPEARRVYEEVIIPFWRGKSMRDLIFREMTDEWKSAYEAGIFTEFLEQRARPHRPGRQNLPQRHAGLSGGHLARPGKPGLWFRAPTGAAPPRFSDRLPRWTMFAPAGRCSTRNLLSLVF